MRTGTVSYRLEDLKNGVIIPIGFVGENDFTRVFFDAEEIYKKFPNASVSMKVQPPKGGIYPATVTRDGNTVIWQVKEADVAHRGGGELQLTFTDGETKIKTYIAKTDVKRSLVGNGPAPDPIQGWIDDAEEVLDDLEAMDTIAKNAQAGDIGKALSPKTVEDGVVTEWQYIETGGGTEDYSDLENKPSIGGVTLAGDKSLHDLGIAAESAIPDVSGKANLSVVAPAFDQATANDAGSLVTYTDGVVYVLPEGHTAGTTWANTQKTATNIAEQQRLLKNAIQGKYEKPSGGIPATDIAPGVIPSIPTIATSAQIKEGTDETHPLAPVRQHEAVFFALAKLAGADMASLSPVTVGQFPDTQKTAIQKMLGIYESPWELIREDTVTNATDANIEITVDGDGNSFELTDVRLMFCSPVQETQFVKGDYGKIKFGYGTGSDADSCFIGAYTQAANASRKISYCEIEQKNGMIKKQYTQNATNGGNANIQTYVNDAEQSYFIKPNSVRYYNKIIITNVTGTAKYKLYGKRKWN